MRVLLLNTDYQAFLTDLYASAPALCSASYDEQMRVRNESQFGTADFYSSSLRELGHEAWDVHFNNVHMQGAWAREHGLPDKPAWALRFRRGIVPWPARAVNPWLSRILHAQIRELRPDVLLTTDMNRFDEAEVRRWQSMGCFVVGIGEPPYSDPQRDRTTYDLVLAPSESMVEFFARSGARTKLLRFAFDGRQKAAVDNERPIDVSFVGSLSKMHTRRIDILESLSRRLPGVLQVWAPCLDEVAVDSPLRDCYRGPAWGRDANDILRKSKIQLNIHHDSAGNDADNIRMFDATGFGALLLTDRKKNLPTIFEVGAEILDFETVEECHQRIVWALANPATRKTIAAKGQARTMKEHTFLDRMRTLEEIVADEMNRRCTGDRSSRPGLAL